MRATQRRVLARRVDERRRRLCKEHSVGKRVNANVQRIGTYAGRCAGDRRHRQEGRGKEQAAEKAHVTS